LKSFANAAAVRNSYLVQYEQLRECSWASNDTDDAYAEQIFLPLDIVANCGQIDRIADDLIIARELAPVGRLQEWAALRPSFCTTCLSTHDSYFNGIILFYYFIIISLQRKDYYDFEGVVALQELWILLVGTNRYFNK
jgi:hypothetical protein